MSPNKAFDASQTLPSTTSGRQIQLCPSVTTCNDTTFGRVAGIAMLLKVPNAAKHPKLCQVLPTHMFPDATPEDVESNERDETRLQEDLIATKERLVLAEEDDRDLRRELGQSRGGLMSGRLSMSWRRRYEMRKMHSTPAGPSLPKRPNS